MKSGKKREGKTVFRTVLQPLMILTLLEAAIVLGVTVLSGVYSQLNSNERSILRQTVVNRANYLEGDMTDRWSDIEKLAREINDETVRLCAAPRKHTSSSKRSRRRLSKRCTASRQQVFISSLIRRI